MLNHQYFTNHQIILFYVSILLTVFSTALFYKQKYSLSILLLFAGSLVFGVFMGILDPYLHYWDEQFHALVAKNMTEHPFEPMLYKNPEIGYSYENWIANNIWLHKQPLFLWQIALSIDIFGATPFAVRFPSILMHAIMVLLIYRIGSKMVNKRTGYYGAFLFTFSNYILELMVGTISSEHNDMAFVFYTTASIWAWVELNSSKNNKWIFAIGFFAGCAVLNKWLPGLLVFGAWSFAIISSKEDRLNFKSYLKPIYAFLIALVVFLPWQIYTLIRFPIESRYELNLNSLHFSQSIEGHGGDWLFHFNNIGVLYGKGFIVPFFLLIGFILLLVFSKEKKYRVFILSAIILVYSFYSIAATKMYSFTLIVAVFAFLSMGIIFDRFEELLNRYLKKPKIISILILSLLFFFGWLSIDINEIENNHTYINIENNPTKNLKENELLLFEYLSNRIPDTSYAFFNLPFFSQVPFMFHKGYHAAYDFYPSEEQCKDLKNRNIKFVVVDNNRNDMPKYIINDTTIRIIKNIYW